MQCLLHRIVIPMFIFIYKIVYTVCSMLHNIVFRITGPLHVTYKYNKYTNSFKNVTPNYYLDFFKNNYDNGEYFRITYTQYLTNYYSCKSNFSSIPQLTTQNKTKIKRRDLVLLDIDKNTINFDLNLLDNLYINSIKINNDYDLDLLTALNFFSIDNCSFVEFVQIIPFKKHLVDAEIVRLSELFN